MSIRLPLINNKDEGQADFVIAKSSEIKYNREKGGIK
jgi:hypothetical protein